MREATAHAVPQGVVEPEKTDSSRRPAADPLGPLCVRFGVRKRHAVPDDHDRLDRAGFNPRAVAFETGCCALDLLRVGVPGGVGVPASRSVCEDGPCVSATSVEG